MEIPKKSIMIGPTLAKHLDSLLTIDDAMTHNEILQRFIKSKEGHFSCGVIEPDQTMIFKGGGDRAWYHGVGVTPTPIRAPKKDPDLVYCGGRAVGKSHNNQRYLEFLSKRRDVQVLDISKPKRDKNKKKIAKKSRRKNRS